MLPRGGEGLVEVVAALGQVGAVDREAGEQLADRVGDGVLVGALLPRLQDALDLAGDAQDLGVQDAVGDGALVVVDHLLPVHGRAAEPVLERGQRCLAGRVGEQPVDEREGVVAGGAGGRPVGGQVLARLEDLLDQHVGAAGEGGEVVEVALGVAQAVGVVDPQPVDEALVEPPLDLDVGLGEDLGVLDAHGGEGVDGEEAAVVEVLVGRAPVDQLVVLLLQRGRAGSEREALVVVADLVPSRPRMAPSSSSPMTGMTMRPSPAAQSTSKADACSDSRPSLRTSHHHGSSDGVATPTWLGTMSTSTPIPRRLASADSAARPSSPPRSGSTWSKATTS